ncbi:hypothetical protein FGG78_25350, partial [Thioclava sp. BHET1]
MSLEILSLGLCVLCVVLLVHVGGVQLLAHSARRSRLARMRFTAQEVPARPSLNAQGTAGPLRRLSRWCRHLALITGERVAILKGAEAEKSAATLMAAGFRSRDALLIYSFLKLSVPLVMLTVSALWFVLVGR